MVNLQPEMDEPPNVYVYNPLHQGKNIGRRTGKQIHKKRDIKNGMNNFDEYLTDSGDERSINVTRLTPLNSTENMASSSIHESAAVTEKGSENKRKTVQGQIISGKLKGKMAAPLQLPQMPSEQNSRNVTVINPFAAGSRFGRRTGKDILAGKKTKMLANGMENFSDFLSDSDVSMSVHHTPSQSSVQVSTPSTSAKESDGDMSPNQSEDHEDPQDSTDTQETLRHDRADSTAASGNSEISINCEAMRSRKSRASEATRLNEPEINPAYKSHTMENQDTGGTALKTQKEKGQMTKSVLESSRVVYSDNKNNGDISIKYPTEKGSQQAEEDLHVDDAKTHKFAKDRSLLKQSHLEVPVGTLNGKQKGSSSGEKKADHTEEGTRAMHTDVINQAVSSICVTAEVHHEQEYTIPNAGLDEEKSFDEESDNHDDPENERDSGIVGPKSVSLNGKTAPRKASERFSKSICDKSTSREIQVSKTYSSKMNSMVEDRDKQIQDPHVGVTFCDDKNDELAQTNVTRPAKADQTLSKSVVPASDVTTSDAPLTKGGYKKAVVNQQTQPVEFHETVSEGTSQSRSLAKPSQSPPVPLDFGGDVTGSVTNSKAPSGHFFGIKKRLSYSVALADSEGAVKKRNDENAKSKKEGKPARSIGSFLDQHNNGEEVDYSDLRPVCGTLISLAPRKVSYLASQGKGDSTDTPSSDFDIIEEEMVVVSTSLNAGKSNKKNQSSGKVDKRKSTNNDKPGVVKMTKMKLKDRGKTELDLGENDGPPERTAKGKAQKAVEDDGLQDPNVDINDGDVGKKVKVNKAVKDSARDETDKIVVEENTSTLNCEDDHPTQTLKHKMNEKVKEKRNGAAKAKKTDEVELTNVTRGKRKPTKQNSLIPVPKKQMKGVRNLNSDLQQQSEPSDNGSGVLSTETAENVPSETNSEIQRAVRSRRKVSPLQYPSFEPDKKGEGKGSTKPPKAVVGKSKAQQVKDKIKKRMAQQNLSQRRKSKIQTRTTSKHSILTHDQSPDHTVHISEHETENTKTNLRKHKPKNDTETEIEDQETTDHRKAKTSNRSGLQKSLKNTRVQTDLSYFHYSTHETEKSCQHDSSSSQLPGQEDVDDTEKNNTNNSHTGIVHKQLPQTDSLHQDDVKIDEGNSSAEFQEKDTKKQKSRGRSRRGITNVCKANEDSIRNTSTAGTQTANISQVPKHSRPDNVRQEFAEYSVPVKSSLGKKENATSNAASGTKRRSVRSSTLKRKSVISPKEREEDACSPVRLQYLSTLPNVTPQSGVSFRISRCFTSTQIEAEEESLSLEAAPPPVLDAGSTPSARPLEAPAVLTSCLKDTCSVKPKKRGRRVRISNIFDCQEAKSLHNEESRYAIEMSSTTILSPSASPVHYAETTTNADVHSSDKSCKIILPDLSYKIIRPDDNAQPGLRRSNRTRVQRLNSFKGEEIIYRRDSTGFGLLVEAVQPSIGEAKVKAQEEERRKRLRQRKIKAMSVPARSKKRLSTHWKVNEDITTSTEIPVINPDNNQEVVVDLIAHREPAEWFGPDLAPVTETDPIAVCLQLQQPAFSTGEMHMRPLATKVRELTEQTLIFNVIYGKICLTINEVSTIVETGDDFFIPRGTCYSMKNLRRDVAKLHFVDLGDALSSDADMATRVNESTNGSDK